MSKEDIDTLEAPHEYKSIVNILGSVEDWQVQANIIANLVANFTEESTVPEAFSKKELKKIKTVNDYYNLRKETWDALGSDVKTQLKKNSEKRWEELKKLRDSL